MIPEHPTFHVQSDFNPVVQSALRMIAEGTDFDPDPVGTAVWVAPCLLMTAKHNIDYVVRKYGPRKISSDNNLGCFVHFYQVWPGPNYAVWGATDIWCSAESDIAFIDVKLVGYSDPTEKPPPTRSLRLRCLPPAEGARVVGFGYHSSVAKIQRREDGNFIDFSDVPQATTGVVVEVFHDRRDRSMYSFPCFQVNARFDGGMSGGPVFDEDGALIGLISGSLPAEGDSEHVSYVATLWPALRTLVESRMLGAEGVTYPAIDLALSGKLLVMDLPKLNPNWFPGRRLPSS